MGDTWQVIFFRSVLLLPLASCLFARPSFAEALDERACSGPILLIDAGMDSSWRPALAELQGRLPAFPDVDPCATVRIFAASPGVLVEVELADGRAAVRRVESKDTLTVVIESLVTRIPASTHAAAPAQPQPSGPPLETPPPPASTVAMRALELGVAGSGRIAGTPHYAGYGLTLYVDLLRDFWLFGSWIRWNFQELPLRRDNVPRDLLMASFLWGAFAGRRFALGRTALDLAAGLNMMIENQEAFEGTANDVGGEFADMTLGGAVRWTVPAVPGPAFFALLGAEVYPTRVGHIVQRAASLPPLPSWGVSLALGFAWSVLQ